MLFSGLYDTIMNTLDNGKGGLESSLTSYFSSVIGGALIGTAISPGIGTAIGAVGGAVVDGLTFFFSNPKAMENVKNAIQNGELPKNVRLGLLSGLINEFGMDTGTALKISDWITKMWVQPVQDFYDGIVSKAKEAWNSCQVVWAVANIWFYTNVIQPVSNAFETVTNAVSGFFSNMWTGIKNGASSAINWIIGGIEDAINGMISGINWFIKKFNGIGEWASKVTGQTFYFVNEIQPVSLGRVSFQDGGFPEDGLFFANHNELVGQFSNGRTAVANNEQIVEGIAGGVASANEEQNKLLREQNRLLMRLLDKDSTISVSTITSAMNRQNKRNGKVTVPVGT